MLIFEVNLYDNATRSRLNAEPERIMAFEGIRNLTPVVGSGLVALERGAAGQPRRRGRAAVEDWLAKHPEWFEPDPEAPRVEPSIARRDAPASRDAVAAAPAE